MPTFTAKTPIKLGGERYEEGDDIELTDKQAKSLLADGAVEPKGAAKPAKPAKSAKADDEK